MPTREDELEAFKTRINLSEYAAARGYEIDRKSTSRNSVCMRHPDGDKIILGMGADQHWIYFSVHDPADHGSIIDFVQARQRLNLGQIRRELRPWLDGCGGPPTSALPRPAASQYAQRLEPVPRDLVGVRARWAAAQDVSAHPYLCHERAIPTALLAAEPFRGRVRLDERGNALFPHWNEDGLCGFEIKNRGFTGFAPGGQKGLWGSRKRDSDRRLVIAETAIDALSHAALFGWADARFVSIAGQMNLQQPALLDQAMRKMPDGSVIVAAVDHDEGGDAIHTQIKTVFDGLRRPQIALERHHPPTPGQDWNDALRASVGQSGPVPDGPVTEGPD